MNPWKAIPLPYRVLILLALAIGACSYFFDLGRSYERSAWETRAAQAETAQTKQEAARQLAGFVTALKAATSGTQALENYVERTEKDRPAVARVVERIRTVCLRQPAPAGGVPVPQGAGLDEEAGRQAEVGGDDAAFVEAVESDIPVCSDELARLDAIAQHLRRQDGDEP